MTSIKNKQTSSLRRGFGRSFRSALLPLSVIGAVLGATLSAEKEASADFVSLGEGVASTLVTNTVSCLIGGTIAPDKLLTCMLAGGTSTGGASLSLADIEQAVTTELGNLQVQNAADNATLVLDAVKGYNRGTSVGSLELAKNAIGGGTGSGIVYLAEQVMASCTAANLGVKAADTYYVMAAVRVAFRNEYYEVMRLLNEAYKAERAVSVVGSADYYHYNDKILKDSELLQLATIAATDAAGIRDQLQAFSDLIDSGSTTSTPPIGFGAVTYDAPSPDSSTVVCTIGNIVTGDTKNKRKSRYCFVDPSVSSGKTCSDYQYWTTYSHNRCGSDQFENADTKAKQSMQLAYLREKTKIAYRSKMIGQQLFETISNYNRMANHQYEYCGNATCALGEISSCAADCGESAAGGKFHETSAITLTRSQSRTLLESDKARLDWQAAGNLVLYSKTDGSMLWSSDTNGTGYTMDYQAGGNLVIYGSSNNILWQSSTSAANNGKLVLVGGLLHVIDADGVSAWNSGDDANIHARMSGQFCYTQPASDMTLLSNQKYTMKWKTNGSLVVSDAAGTESFSTAAKGVGSYLCNQEDGQLAIYNETGAALWQSMTYNHRGAFLALTAQQVRMESAADNTIWASSYCSKFGCTDGEVKTKVMNECDTVSASAMTIMSNNDAILYWQDDGNLVLRNQKTGVALWDTATSGRGHNLCLQSDGNMVVYGSDSSVKFSAASVGSKTMVLAGCNLSLVDDTNHTYWSSKTNCD